MHSLHEASPAQPLKKACSSRLSSLSSQLSTSHMGAVQDSFLASEVVGAGDTFRPVSRDETD